MPLCGCLEEVSPLWACICVHALIVTERKSLSVWMCAGLSALIREIRAMSQDVADLLMHQWQCSGLVPHLLYTCNQFTTKSFGVSLLSAPAHLLTDGPSLWLLFFITLCCFQEPSASNAHLKAAENLPVNEWIPPILFAEDFGRQSTFILLRLVLLALEEMKFYGVNCSLAEAFIMQ